MCNLIKMLLLFFVLSKFNLEFHSTSGRHLFDTNYFVSLSFSVQIFLSISFIQSITHKHAIKERN